MKSTTAICRKRSSTANRAIATLRTLPCSATTTRKCTRINRTSTCVTSAPRATTFTRRTSRTLTPTTRKPRRSNSCRWSGFSVRIVTLGFISEVCASTCSVTLELNGATSAGRNVRAL
uniref:(northern house mosquito) hypothetical protein n=1 Tax=Culex pipiens TaxID=7175 RepID=A0A8D8H975_CULPI